MCDNRTHTSMPMLVGKDITGIPWYRRVVTIVNKDGGLVIITQYSNNSMDNWVDVSTVHTKEDSNDKKKVVDEYKNTDSIESTY